MKAEYQQSLKQAIETIAQVKRKLAGDVQSEEINVQRQNQELHNLDTRFRLGRSQQIIYRKLNNEYGKYSDLRLILKKPNVFRHLNLLLM